jgi:hypothetical protein
MKREPYFSNWKRIKNVSIGLVYVFFTLWLIFHTNQYVPAGQEDFWFRVFIGYGLLNALIFGSADLRNKLFNVKFTDFLPRVAIFFAISLIVFYLILSRVDPTAQSLMVTLTAIPVWLAAIHAVVFAITESVVWQGFLDYKLGHPWSELVAGLFHFGIWSGSAFVVIISASVLFMIFSLVNWYFRKDKNDLAPAIGTHVAFNFVKIGIMVSTGAVAFA